jgi:hypothetical protein
VVGVAPAPNKSEDIALGIKAIVEKLMGEK